MRNTQSTILWVTLVNVVAVLVWFAVATTEANQVSTGSLVALMIALIAIGASAHSVSQRIFNNSILQPLRDIQSTTQAIAEGASSGRVTVGGMSATEVREVATSINNLARKATNDIDEMKRLERVRSEFIGNVSHELRTPIFSVQGYLETLLDGAMDDPEVARQFLDKALANALRLNVLLTDLIEISKIESGQLRFSFRYFDISALIREITMVMEIRGEQRGIKLVVAIPDKEVLSVYGDKERLTQVLTNLIDNAVKYNRENGMVTVSASQGDEIVKVTIADTGVGIPQTDVGRIFERFYRVDKDRSRAVGGTGLGLSIVKHILEAHNTHATVSSEQGVGTEISFSLKSS